MARGNESMSAVVRFSLGTGIYLGSRALSGLYVAGRDTVDAAARLADSRKLAEHLVANHVANQQAMLIDEIVRRQQDYPIVDLCALRYVKLSALHGEGIAVTGQEPTDPHITAIEYIMLDKGIREPTVEKAVDWVREVVPEVVTLESRGFSSL